MHKKLEMKQSKGTRKDLRDSEITSGWGGKAGNQDEALWILLHGEKSKES